MHEALAPFEEYENCRGGEGLPLEVIVSEGPLLSVDVMTAWVDSKLAEVEAREPWRFERYDESTVVLP
jgi:hypothetical protein